ncbi:MAG: hypothetical protein ABT02_16345 [Comamonadaceae bacterium SCN 68-20]|nr:MAG: hypothetical protein ABT02_16345 [Comamonadaceae bacterium SCN 68-20]OJX19328.1 MAG: hypothetical protein BGO75_08885 [Burkholderiales bacterium 68-20]
MKAHFRQSMVWLHTWASVVSGWLLFFVFVTGTASCFLYDTTRWMEPERPLELVSRHAPAAAQAEGALDFLALHAPAAEKWEIKLPHARNHPDNGASRTRLVARAFPGGLRWELDPLTARELLPLDVRATEGAGAFRSLHHQLHYMDKVVGIYIVGVVAMLALVSLATGVIAHKKIFKDFFTFRPGKGQRSWLDAHNVTGVMALPFFVMILWTGLVYFNYHYLPVPSKTMNATVNGRPLPQFDAAAVPVVRPRARLAPMIEQAEAVLGAGQIGQIWVERRAGEPPVVDISRPWGTELPRTKNPQTFIRFNALTGERLPSPYSEGPGRTMLLALVALHEAWYANDPLRWLYFLSGLLGCFMIATGMVLWVVKRRERHAREGSAASGGLRFVARLNVGVLAGLPTGVAACFWANRLLPVTMPGRADWELHCLFAAWGWLALYAIARPERRAWVELLALAALAFGLLPLLNALTTDRHLGVTLPAGDGGLAGVDLTMLALAAMFAAMALRLQRRWQGAA